MPSPPGKLPEQLRNAKRRPKGSPAPPIIEQLQGISIKSLKIHSLKGGKVVRMPAVSLRWPFLIGLRLCNEAVEFTLSPQHRGSIKPTQTFGVKPYRVGRNAIGYLFICDCGCA